MLFKAAMSDTPPDHPDRNRRKLYGRRKGPKLSARQAGLRRTLLGDLAWRVGAAPLQYVWAVHSRGGNADQNLARIRAGHRPPHQLQDLRSARLGWINRVHFVRQIGHGHPFVKQAFLLT